jgi:hypothetical protein
VKPSKPNKIFCQEIKCPDYLTDEGEPAWCYHAGQPAEVAALKCPKVTDNQINKDTGGCTNR